LARQLVEESGKITKLTNTYIRSLSLVFLFAFFYILVINFFGIKIFNLIYNDEIILKESMMLILALSFVFQGFGYPGARLLSASGRPSIVLESGIIFGIIFIIFLAMFSSNITLVLISLGLCLSRMIATFYTTAISFIYLNSKR
jgi:O-antigen/teichoic acid export membrane protein